MAGDPRSEILQMMMQELAGGSGRAQGRQPDMGFTDSDISRRVNESRGMMTPRGERPRPPELDMPPPAVAPGMQGGLPPEIMKLASLGIGPQEMGIDMGRPSPSPYPRTGSTDADSEDAVNESRRSMTPSDEEPEPAEMMDSPRDQRFGPQDDRLRDETESELADVRQSMGRREISEIAEEIRAAIDDNDQATYKSLVDELEETGIDPSELPPDIQKMMEENDANDDERGSTEDPQDA